MNRIKYKRGKAMADIMNYFNCIPGILIERFDIKYFDNTATIKIWFFENKNDISVKNITIKANFV